MMKRVLISALALGASSMMLTGFDNNAAVEEVLEKYSEASQAADHFSAAADLAVDIDFSVALEGAGTESVSINVDGNIDLAMTENPIALAADAAISVRLPGEDEETANVKLYMDTAEDGSLDLYAGLVEGAGISWEYLTAVPAEQMEQITSALTQSGYDPSNLIGTYTLGEEAVDVNGITCYQLLNTLTYEDIRPTLEEALKASGEGIDDATLGMVAVALTNLVFNTEIDIDAETYLPVKMHMDMDGSDFSMLSTLLAYSYMQVGDDGSMSLPEVSLDVNALYVEAVYDYDTPVEITVPEEALAQKGNGSALDLDEALGEIAS